MYLCTYVLRFQLKSVSVEKCEHAFCEERAIQFDTKTENKFVKIIDGIISNTLQQETILFYLRITMALGGNKWSVSPIYHSGQLPH
jgi:translation initiation factor 1 (eIF-1/SUI1)